MDLEFQLTPPFPDENQEQVQHQEDHRPVPLSTQPGFTPVDLQTPLSYSGVLHVWSPDQCKQTALCKPGAEFVS
jgi:hypothetical protein